MKISPKKRYAVLTGDIVDSSKLPKAERQRLPHALKQAAKQTQKAFPGVAPLDLDVFRGDSWQWLLETDVRALRVALYFRASLQAARAARGHGVDTRMSIAVGSVDFIPKGQVSEGDGEAYRASGQGLEALPGNQFLALSLGKTAVPAGVSVVVQLLDALAQGWTAKQAQAVAGALRGWTQEKIAQEWPARITQPAVAKHLGRAFWPSVENALNYIEVSVQGSLAEGTA